MRPCRPEALAVDTAAPACCSLRDDLDMAEPKTRPTDVDVNAFLDAVPNLRRRDDAKVVCELLREVSGETPVLWGTSIVGFGRVRLTYASGREVDTPVTGFAARKANTTVYLLDGFEERADLLARLGPHTIGKACLYIKRVSDVDLDVLRELVADSVRQVRLGL
jgi:hypothetical protein